MDTEALYQRSMVFKLREDYTQPLWRTDDESGQRDKRNSNPIESLAYWKRGIA